MPLEKMTEEEIEKLLTAGGTTAKPVILKKLENGCIVCTSHRGDKDGYLLLRRNRKDVKGHRMVYEHFYGPIPEGLCVLHACDYPPCQNPDHLFLGTNADNSRDMVEKGRNNPGDQRGEMNGNAKLTEEKVLEIRRKYATGLYTQKELAKESGIGKSMIGYIVINQFWRHITVHLQEAPCP